MSFNLIRKSCAELLLSILQPVTLKKMQLRDSSPLYRIFFFSEKFKIWSP